MKKTNKKQIPKVRLPKYSPGGTQDAYNQKRSKGLSNGQYAQYAAIAANTGSNIYGIQNSDIGNTSKTKATTGAIGEGVTQGIGTINPLIGAGTGIRKTAVGMVGDKQGAARTASNWAAAPHESAINDIGAISSADNNTQKAGSVVAAIGDITGMTKMRQMISYGTKNDEKTTGGWGKYNDMVGISSRNNQKQDILNEQTQQQEAAQAAQDSQQAAYQQQQTDFINNAVESGIANYNQNNPQGGANNTIQYAKYGGQMKFAMGGMNMQPNAELENREMYRKTNGQINEVNGNSHEEGGVPINIPGGTEMLPDNASNFLRINKKIVFQNPGLFTKKDIGKTFSESSRNLKTTKEEKNINNKDATPLSQTTNSLIMNAKNIIYSRKMDVLKQVKQDKVAAYAKKMGVELPSMNNEQMELQGMPEQAEGEMPMARHGGRFALGGVQLPYYNIDRNGNPKYGMGGFNDGEPLTSVNTSTITNAKKVDTIPTNYTKIGTQGNKTYYDLPSDIAKNNPAGGKVSSGWENSIIKRFN